MVGLFLFVTSAAAISVAIKSKPNQVDKLYSTPSSHLISTSVENYINLQYYAYFSFGTPGQILSLSLDTGSSHIWIPSLHCDCHQAQNYFDPSASATYVNTSKSTTVEYGKGSVEGFISKDTVSLQGLAAQSQYFILATKNNDFDSHQSDGLLGLSFGKPNEKHPTFIQSLKSQGKIESAIFSIYLNSLNTPYLESAFTIGEYNFGLYGQSDIKYININSTRGYWFAKVSRIGLGGILNVDENQTYAMFDTGTSMIVGPPQIIDKFKSEVQKKVNCNDDHSYLICKCKFNEYDNFPSLDFTIEDQVFSVTPQSYVYYEDGKCHLFIKGKDRGFWIFGQAFLREYYSVYDMENLQVLLSKAVRSSKEDTKWIWYLILGGAAGTMIFIALITIIIVRKKNNPLRQSLIH